MGKPGKPTGVIWQKRAEGMVSGAEDYYSKGINFPLMLSFGN